MRRPAFLGFIWLAVIVSPGVAAESRRGSPNENGAGAPRSGQDFTLGQPAMPLIWIAPGTFRMSSTHGAGDDTWVTLTHGYWLGRTEVTQAQWQVVMDRIPVPAFFKGSERPVERISWGAVMEFCVKLTKLEHTAGRLPEGYRYTLPTEAQWEYACRAGTTGKYAGEIDAMAWHGGNSGGQTHPVAQKKPNAWGFYDMHGNVLEWCADWYARYPGGAVSDPTGPALGQFHIARGGVWNGSAGFCRSGYRYWHPSSIGNEGTGFRLALVSQSVMPVVEQRERGVSGTGARQ